MFVLTLGALGLAAAAHFWLHGLARHLTARALGVKGTRLPLAISDREAYRASPPARRLLAAAAGPLANYALCALTFMAAMVVVGTPQPTTRIEQVIQGGPAAAAGLRAGDRILALDGKPVAIASEVPDTIRTRGSGPLQLELERAGQRQTMTAEIRDGRIGIRLATERQGVSPGALGRAVVLPAETMLNAARALVPSSAPATFTGPIGILRMVSESPSEQVGQLLSLLAVYTAQFWPLAILLAFLNNRAPAPRRAA
jgi:membrane-associated protease RseP (regulator of RpoE activity)